MGSSAVVEVQQMLAQILQHKHLEVAEMHRTISLLQLQQQIAAAPPVRDLITALDQSHDRPSLIAEVKQASPSRGILRERFDPVSIAQAYARGGASCLSVLTDHHFFQGSFANLAMIRQHVDLPLLCKEFIIDRHQIYLARSGGADAILLIAAILTDTDLQSHLNLAHELGMTALIEVHTLAELDRVLTLKDVQLVGINNRNLENFEVDINTTEQIMSARSRQLQQRHITTVSESGLFTPADLARVAQAGARAVLVGEALLKQPNLEIAVRSLLNAAPTS
jgi:indole-3-glycerol phosphate synthase